MAAAAQIGSIARISGSQSSPILAAIALHYAFGSISVPVSDQNFFFVGMMAVGKTTIGRALARSLKLPFYDTDQVITERAGAEISWIFDVEGESGFRAREESVIDELTQKCGIVLATGGGAVLSERNRKCLCSRGVVIHLDSPLERLIKRTARDSKRPLLQSENPRATLERLWRKRTPLYRSVADYTFVTDKQSVKSLVAQIRARLQKDGVVA